jgi:N4-gp56 family major capsid protein
MIYNDISPRTQAYADRRLLTRIERNNILGQFGEVRPIPQGATKSISFRRYNKLANATTPLAEGVTPTGKTLTKTDILVTLQQFGDFTWISDVIQDTHEDPVLRESIDVLGLQADETYDVLRAGILSAGSNVLYGNGTSRSAVNNSIQRGNVRTAIRILKRQESRAITSIIKAGPNINTFPIPPAYVCVCHADIQPDLEQLTDWVPVARYSSTMGLIKGEIGSCGETRWVIDNNVTPWADAGGLAATNGTLSTSGTSSDVYPVLIFGEKAYGLVQLAGKGAVQTYVNNPKPVDSDPLAQRGTVGWKGYHAAVILQDLWMLRLEVAAKG